MTTMKDNESFGLLIEMIKHLDDKQTQANINLDNKISYTYDKLMENNNSIIELANTIKNLTDEIKIHNGRLKKTEERIECLEGMSGRIKHINNNFIWYILLIILFAGLIASNGNKILENIINILAKII